MILRILNATNPDKKKNGSIVNRSTTPSKEHINFMIAFAFESSGYNKSEVQILRPYSIQKIIIVNRAIASRIGK